MCPTHHTKYNGFTLNHLYNTFPYILDCIKNGYGIGKLAKHHVSMVACVGNTPLGVNILVKKYDRFNSPPITSTAPNFPQSDQDFSLWGLKSHSFPYQKIIFSHGGYLSFIFIQMIFLLRYYTIVSKTFQRESFFDFTKNLFNKSKYFHFLIGPFYYFLSIFYWMYFHQTSK